MIFEHRTPILRFKKYVLIGRERVLVSPGLVLWEFRIGVLSLYCDWCLELVLSEPHIGILSLSYDLKGIALTGNLRGIERVATTVLSCWNFTYCN
jgi:hypothetical protein